MGGGKKSFVCKTRLISIVSKPNEVVVVVVVINSQSDKVTKSHSAQIEVPGQMSHTQRNKVYGIRYKR